MPTAIEKYRQIGGMWERGSDAACWKLDGRGTVLDNVVVRGSGVVGGSSGVYRRIKGGRKQ